MNFFVAEKTTDCKTMSSITLENGLLEITIPNGATRQDIVEFVREIDKEKLKEIAEKQKENLKNFQEKAQQMIKKHSDELDLDIPITLQIEDHPKKYLCEGKVKKHGKKVEGKMMLSKPLQFMPEDMVDKIIRSAVYMVAIEFENLWCKDTPPNLDREQYWIKLAGDDLDKLKSKYLEAYQQFMAKMNESYYHEMGLDM